MSEKLLAHYDIRSDAAGIADRARAIAIEQSVEMPVAAICDPRVLDDIVGRVEGISDLGGGYYRATVALDVETTGFEAGQLLNMVFGNSSIHDDVTLAAVTVPERLARAFTGPRHGPQGLRSRVGAGHRALTCAALKPQGLSSQGLADIARRLALGGIDYIKDDHGLADQRHAPFAERVRVVAAAVGGASAVTGKPTRYLPSLSGNLDRLRAQVVIARECGLDTLLIAPMIVGLASFDALVRENADMAFIAHPAMAGAARIAPSALMGTLLRLIGADGVIFPNVGGRFGYSEAMCREIAATCLAPWGTITPTMPVPAGGMTLPRIGEILAVYGADAMLLIGGDLLAAGDGMTAAAAAFQRKVEGDGPGAH